MIEIKLKNVRCYSHHGCLKEETLIGSEYLVTLSVKTKLGKSHLTDSLEDAVDYVFLNSVIKEEMAVSSKLLETVVKKICNRVLSEEKRVYEVTVRVSKLCPPINGDAESVSVKITEKREENF